MTTLVWDQLGEHVYETGIRKGVLYSDGHGIPWNGLTAVDESIDSEIESVYFDGVKIDDLITLGDFSATLKALTYPDEFLFHEGTIEAAVGFSVTGQEAHRFGLSYQTLVGNDLGTEHYKIHLVYNLTAIPSSKSFETLSEEVNPTEFEWSITSIPEKISNYRPTAHVVFDSRKIHPLLMKDIQGILYGDETRPAMLPALDSIALFIRKWHRLVIIDNGDGTWTANDPFEQGFITMLDGTTFSITTDTATYLDDDTYIVSSTEANEDDL